MTKEDILHHFQDINFYYGDCMMYADLSGMLDELIAENKAEWLEDVKAKIKAMFPPYGDWMYDEEYEHEHTVCEVLSDVLQILDKISAEIEEKMSHYDHFENSNTANGLRIAREIVEKHKGDSEC